MVALERLHLNGAEFRTVGCYPHRWEADRMVSRDDSRTLAVWPQPGPEPRGVGERLLAEPHDSPALDRLMRQGRWREETVGEYATFGTWHDREEPPVRGQRVTVEERGLDYRGEPRDHRIQPHVPLPKYDRSAPGDPERTLFVVVRRDPQEPAVWRVDEITFDRNQAVSAALKAEHQERLNRQMNDPKQWPTMSLTL